MGQFFLEHSIQSFAFFIHSNVHEKIMVFREYIGEMFCCRVWVAPPPRLVFSCMSIVVDIFMCLLCACYVHQGNYVLSV